MNDTPWVRVLVVNFNGGPYLQRCIDSLARQSMADFEAVIIDNASTDDSVTTLSLPDARFTLISAGSNLGFAQANNLAARDSKTRWLACLNPDAVAEQDWLAKLREATQRHTEAAMFGSTQLNCDGTQIDGFGDILSLYGLPWRGGHGAPPSELPEDDMEVFAPCAAAALYRRDAFEMVGGFDPTFFCYIEDVDLGFRMRLAGEQCIQVRRAIVRHVGSALTGRTSDFTIFHSFRNRIWMLLKCFPAPLLVPIVPLHLAAALYLLLRTARRSGSVRPALQGILAGLRGGGSLWRQRQRIQQSRRPSVLDIVRWLAWKPSDLRHRRIVHSFAAPSPRWPINDLEPDLDLLRERGGQDYE